MSRTRALGAVLIAGALGLAAWRVSHRRAAELPDRLRLTETITDLVAAFESGAARATAGEPRVGSVRPSRKLLDMAGRFRRAIVAPPPAALRFVLDVPPDAILELGVGVEGAQRREPGAAGVRFTVHVDGRQVYARDVNPAATRHDRRWHDERVDLAAWSGRRVELVLATGPAGTGTSPGTPGWSHLRLVRETWHARQPARPGAPNVLVLLVDTLRADRLGCYGARPSPSPVVDRLAADGLVFAHAVAQSSWTMPSVASIFTGLHPHSHGVIGARAGPARGGTAEDADRTSLPDTIPTLAEHATRGGITTVGASGNPLVSRETRLARGFETFVEFGWDTAAGDFTAGAAELNAAFLSWLGRNREHRFLAYLQYMDPHAPYTPPAPPPPPAGVRATVAAGDPHALAAELRAGGPPLSGDEVAHLRALYDAEIRSWDAELAHLLDGLDALGLRTNTVVVVTADHGEEFDEHGALQHGAHLYDETIRVPLVVVGPSVPRGRVAEQAQGIDLLPTVLALLGLPPAPGVPGQDLLAPRELRPAISETRYGVPDAGGDQLLSLRVPGWKLIHAPATGRYELYDLAHDPAEHDDRFAVEPVGRTLAAELAAWRSSAPAAPPPPGDDPAVRERLRALGYVD